MFDQVLKMRIQLWGSAGDINSFDADTLMEQLNDAVDGAPGHDFRPFRPGFDVTVMARLVTELANIQLNGFDRGSLEWTESLLVKR